MASCLWGQSAADVFHKAPPAVDEALRARITKFFQIHVDGKFRQAEPLIAEDTKDFYYTANKPKYLSFEIRDITYSDDFTKAKAIVVTKMVVMAPGFLDKPVAVPIPSRWKVENGDWYWYVDPDELNVTPFGKMKAGTGGSASSGPPAIPGPEEAARMLQGVKPDHEELELKAKQPGSVEFTIANTMQGKVTLTLDQLVFEGITAKLDTTELAPGATAHVVVDWKPGRYRAQVIEARVRVQPTNQLLRLRVKFMD